MSNPEGYPESPEFNSVLKDMLRAHAAEQFRTGVYKSWIELVDKYYEGKNPDEQAKLSDFAGSEMALGAAVWRDCDRRYPGVNSYFLVKIDVRTGERVKYGPYGTEPIVVAHVDDEGNIIETPEKKRSPTYTDEQVAVVVNQAHELETAGFELNPMPRLGEEPFSIGCSISW